MGSLDRLKVAVTGAAALVAVDAVDNGQLDATMNLVGGSVAAASETAPEYEFGEETVLISGSGHQIPLDVDEVTGDLLHTEAPADWSSFTTKVRLDGETTDSEVSMTDIPSTVWYGEFLETGELALGASDYSIVKCSDSSGGDYTSGDCDETIVSRADNHMPGPFSLDQGNASQPAGEWIGEVWDSGSGTSDLECEDGTELVGGSDNEQYPNADALDRLVYSVCDEYGDNCQIRIMDRNGVYQDTLVTNGMSGAYDPVNGRLIYACWNGTDWDICEREELTGAEEDETPPEVDNGTVNGSEIDEESSNAVPCEDLTIQADVTDNSDGAISVTATWVMEEKDNIELSITEVDDDTIQMTVPVSDDFSELPGQLEITAEDAAGNQTTETWDFAVGQCAAETASYGPGETIETEGGAVIELGEDVISASVDGEHVTATVDSDGGSVADVKSLAEEVLLTVNNTADGGAVTATVTAPANVSAVYGVEGPSGTGSESSDSSTKSTGLTIDVEDYDSPYGVQTEEFMEANAHVGATPRGFNFPGGPTGSPSMNADSATADLSLANYDHWDAEHPDTQLSLVIESEGSGTLTLEGPVDGVMGTMAVGEGDLIVASDWRVGNYEDYQTDGPGNGPGTTPGTEPGDETPGGCSTSGAEGTAGGAALAAIGLMAVAGFRGRENNGQVPTDDKPEVVLDEREDSPEA
jgi:hypothetical protein